MRGGRQYYLHNFLASQPDLNFHNPDVQDWLLSTMRFWLDRGVDGFRLDTVNYYFHDALLRSNPPAPGNDPDPAVNPYEMQLHLYSKTRPENLGFLERLRALTDAYPDRTMVGEVGESHRAVQVMADYTRGQSRLHMAYSFELLGPQFTAAHFRSRIEGFFTGAPDGWPAWAFSNHDVIRHVTRWAGPRRAGRHRAPSRRDAPVVRGLDLPLPGRGTGPDRDRYPVPRVDRPARHHLLARLQGP